MPAVSWLSIAVIAGFLLPRLLGQDVGESDPRTAEEYLHRGEDRAGKKDYDDAIADYNTALQLKPDCRSLQPPRTRLLLEGVS